MGYPADSTGFFGQSALSLRYISFWPGGVPIRRAGLRLKSPTKVRPANLLADEDHPIPHGQAVFLWHGTLCLAERPCSDSEHHARLVSGADHVLGFGR